MSAREDWDFDSDDKTQMHIVEIVGGIHIDETIKNVLDNEFREFGKVETVLYYRVHNTSSQRELIEKLSIDWTPSDMPWLLVLDDEPPDIKPDDRAILFRLGNLENEDQIKEITRALMRASRDEDFMKHLTWKKRKDSLKEMVPILKETTDLIISVVSVVATA